MILRRGMYCSMSDIWLLLPIRRDLFPMRQVRRSGDVPVKKENSVRRRMILQMHGKERILKGRRSFRIITDCMTPGKKNWPWQREKNTAMPERSTCRRTIPN